jgi:hypothetical protein
MGAPLSPEEVQAFELAHDVVLPEEYRRFLLEVADGGRGPPAHGLMRLGHVPKDHHLRAEERLASLKKPFPLTDLWVWEVEEHLSSAQEQLVDSTCLDGSLVLGTDGCALYWHLIVTGSERGQMWSIGGVGAGPCDPRRTFLSWYEDWLQRVSARG